MKAKLATAVLMVGIALAPGAAGAAWWNPFKKDTPPTDGNAQNQPVPPIPLGNGAGSGQAVGSGPGSGSGVTTNSLPPPSGASFTSGAPPAGGVSAPTPVSSSDSVTIRLDRMEARMRDLTGQIEQLTYQLRQTQDQLRAAQEAAGVPATDAGQPARGRRSETRPAQGAEVVSLGHQADVNLTETPMDGGEAVGDDQVGSRIGAGTARRGDPPRNLGTISANGGATVATTGGGGAASTNAGTTSGAPLNIATLASGGQATGAAPAPGGGAGSNTVASLAPIGGAEDPRMVYDRAYQSILTGDYALAEKGLRGFLGAYPNDKLASDAQYWLGETYYARSMYREAAAAFLAGYKNYPKGSKGAETLLKLGLSLKGLGQRDEACNTFAEVGKRYPKASNAMMQRVKAEQAGASCG